MELQEKLRYGYYKDILNSENEAVKLRAAIQYKEDEENFKLADKTYIGCIYIMWKECVNTAVDGESKMITFMEEFRDPDAECSVDFTGTLSGDLQWIKYGHPKSKFNA